ncbi:MAG: hypothetical protein WC205_14810 [Opitutaceae bacterium]|jgi:hypothetical protein
MTPALQTVPPDSTPDAGPVHRSGPLVTLFALMATLTALFATGLCLQYDRPALIAPALLLFGLPALWWWWCAAWQPGRSCATLPRSLRVLTGALGFDLICTCRGVAPTIFFHPDKATAGADLCLLVFLENYTSRQRLVEVRAGPHPGLGLAGVQTVRLHLAAGQAAVYRWPLRPLPSLAAGSHDLPVVLRVQRPQGMGQWLPGSRRHPYNIWHTRFAVPFTLEASDKKALGHPLPEAAYLSLASISEKEPRLDVLARLVDPA